MFRSLRSSRVTSIASKQSRKFFKDFIEKNLLGKNKESSYSFGNYDIVEPWFLSPERSVPSHIPKPDYAIRPTFRPVGGPEKPEIKNDNQIECMKHSCILAKEVLGEAEHFLKPGVTTDQLDEILHQIIIDNGAYPSPLRYMGYPKSICTSINNVACHGIPDNRPLREGDIINVDVTVFLNGFHGDCSAMFTIGNVDEQAQRLIQATENCLANAISICKPNVKFSTIGSVTEDTAVKEGFQIVPAFAGHGIGNYFHGAPDIFHFANDYPGEMQPGMTFTIEPVLTQGAPDVQILDDGWTAVMVDNARTAQVEHTILITDNGCEILTL